MPRAALVLLLLASCSNSNSERDRAVPAKDVQPDAPSYAGCDEASCRIDNLTRSVCCCYDESHWPSCCPPKVSPIAMTVAAPGGEQYTACNNTMPKGWQFVSPKIVDGGARDRKAVDTITFHCVELDAYEAHLCTTNIVCLSATTCPEWAPVRCPGVWLCVDGHCAYKCPP
jgi:hypothetical protein